MILHSDFNTISSGCEFSRRGLLVNASIGNNVLSLNNCLICPCKREVRKLKVKCLLDLNPSRNVRREDFHVLSRKGRWEMVCGCVNTGRDGNLSVIGGAGIDARRIVLSRLSSRKSEDDRDESRGRVESLLSYREDSGKSSSGGGNSNFASFQEDPFVDKLRTQLGVMHPIPSPPLNRNIFGLFAFFFFVGVVFDKVWTSRKRGNGNGNGNDGVDGRSGKGMGVGMWPQVPSLSMFLEKDLQRKESVEWVNMVLGKLWKVYRGGIEDWIIGLLQPVIDDLKKPDYVERVEIKQFSLGDEPLSVRSVERRTSRRANDLQYQIGLRYTGGARMLLMLSLKFGIVPIVVPVGVRNFDIDGELWVKLRLIPTKPFVGAVSWAFVSLPKIKFDLSAFRLFNLMAIPVLSMFLTKLLTEDLPRLFVRPKKIVLDFQNAKSLGPFPNDLKPGEIQEGNKDFSGELSVTLVDARRLSYILYGKTDPYAILKLGDQVIRSKKNSQTTVFGPPGEPIWNQDFHMLVSDPRKQKLFIEVKDPLGLGDITLGIGEVDLSSLKDTVPTDRIVTLQGWGLFGKRFAGEILLRLTYKAYVEDEEDEKTMFKTSDISDDELTDSDEFDDSAYKQTTKGSTIPIESESFMDVLAALIISEEFQGIVTSDSLNEKFSSSATNTVSSARNPGNNAGSMQETPDDKPRDSRGETLFWLAIVTSITVLTALSISGSSFFNP